MVEKENSFRQLRAKHAFGKSFHLLPYDIQEEIKKSERHFKKEF